MSSRSVGLLSAVAWLASTQAGCTAIISRSRVAAAEDRVLVARQAGAEKRCPYEFTAAGLYLEKAREEEARARYGAAAALADEAVRLAEAARVEAAASAGSTEEEE
ncbi:MAG: hypothetical protein RL199_1113 [Pseudomonadota bacterium]|jgi:hypothetical protein